jgi:hypothetical protein
MYGYKINRSGLRKFMTSDPQLHRALHSNARKILAVARSLAPVDSGDLRASGRVEDYGVRSVQKGEKRMTVAVVFHSRYAMAQEVRTGFLSGAIGRGKKTPGG